MEVTKPCKRLSSTNPEAHKLCRFLVHKKKIPAAKLDTGIPYVDFLKVDPNKATSSPTLSIVASTRGVGKLAQKISTKGDKKLQAGEIYTYALRLLEEENANGQATSKASLSYYLTNLKSFRPPWILNDFDSKTTYDNKLILQIDARIKEIKARLVQEKYTPNGIQYNTELARRLIKFVVEKKSKRGLGIIPLSIPPTALTRERSVLEILTSKDRRVHCTELNYLFYAIFKRAGLKPQFLLVHRDHVGIVSLNHVCIGVQLDPSDPSAITQIDLTEKRKLWFDTPHKLTIPMPKTEALSRFYANKAIALIKATASLTKRPQKTLQKIKALFEKGFHYDPYNPLLSYNFANYHRLIVVDQKQRDFYLKGALTLYPRYEDALKLKQWIYNIPSAKRSPESILPGLYQ